MRPLESAEELEAAAKRATRRMEPLVVYADALLGMVADQPVRAAVGSDGAARAPATDGEAIEVEALSDDADDVGGAASRAETRAAAAAAAKGGAGRYDDEDDDEDDGFLDDLDEEDDDDEEALVETIAPDGAPAAGGAVEAVCTPVGGHAGVLLCVASPDASRGSYWDAVADKTGLSWLSSAASSTGAKLGGNAESWWTKTSEWWAAEMEPLEPVGASAPPMLGDGVAQGGLDAIFGAASPSAAASSQLAQGAAADDGAGALQPISPEDWADMRQFGMRVVESTSDGVQSVRKMFVNFGGSLFVDDGDGDDDDDGRQARQKGQEGRQKGRQEGQEGRARRRGRRAARHAHGGAAARAARTGDRLPDRAAAPAPHADENGRRRRAGRR